MRFLPVIFLSFLFSASAYAEVVGTKPPQWPASYSTNYQSRVIDMKSSITGSISVSKNDKIVSNSQISNSNDSHRSIILRDGSIANIYHMRKSFEGDATICRHFQRPYDLLSQNPSNHCREFQSKREELIDGLLLKGWTTICSISPESLIPDRFHRPPPLNRMMDISLTYYYQDSLPYAIIVSPLTPLGPAVNPNVTINYSNFQLSEPDESLFVPPKDCNDIEEEKPWGRRFGRGRRHHPLPPLPPLPPSNNNDEIVDTPKGEPRDRPHEGRHERPHHSHGFRPYPHRDDDKPDGIFAAIFRRLFGRRHSRNGEMEPPMEAPPPPPMKDIDEPMPRGGGPPLPPINGGPIPAGEVEPRPPMRGGMIGGEEAMGEEGREIIDRHHHRHGGHHGGEGKNDFGEKQLISAHVTRMAMKVIHFVNTNYLQKSR